MKTKLYPTQIEDVERHLSGEDVPNWSEAGTGKTNTALAVTEALGFDSGVVICPTIATRMWKHKLEEELGAKVQLVDTRTTPLSKLADFHVFSYGVVEGHFDALLAGLRDKHNDMLIIDEAHRLKGYNSKRTEMIFGPYNDGEGGIYESSRYCLPLTGTPIERYADDLWPQLRATQPDALQRYHALERHEFQRQFCVMAERSYNGSVPKLVSIGNQNEKLLNRMLNRDIGVVRRTIHDVAPYMPPVTFREVYAKSKASAELKEIMRGLTSEQIEDRLQQSEGSTMHRLLGLSKLADMVEYIAEEARHEPLLVGYWHTEVGDAIIKNLPGKIDALRIGGDTSPAMRDKIRERFIKGEVQVIVGQIAAMGEAMDGLQQRGRRVVFAEDHWSAAKIEQFYKRLYRNGQTLPVQVDFVKSDHAVDEALTRVRERKFSGSKEVLKQAPSGK